ncbi:Presumed portal vertex protein [Xanthomonas citri pv. fuscans]|uniref:phage portal protein n=1 Tax=Xanthomonas citri TaxID=346 RepID=UPI0005388C48|nr:phage portal protein [Xanthomonas citri]KGT56461.1 Presumed portal vertex protein [Xanthomonas citri pv. fuscans]
MLTDQLPAAAPAQATRAEAFTFGDPTPVLDGRGVLDYLECWQNGRWYEPPVALDGLSKTTRSNPFLQSGLIFKRNMLARTFRPHRLMTREAFEQLSLDWITLGNGYLERRRNRMGGALSLTAPLSKYMRRGITEGEYFQVRTWHDEHVFEPGSVFQLREADVDQELYGLPEWMPAMQSALLNESATLFRRKYYNNGSHAGFILYLTDPQQSQEDVDALRNAMKGAKGPGNFRNLFLYSPGGNKDGLKLIPVSEVAAKDEFSGIKGITRDDMLAALRIPPQLMGIVPQNAGGFGSIREAAAVWAANELEPLQARMLKINDWVGDDVISFTPYAPPATA